MLVGLGNIAGESSVKRSEFVAVNAEISRVLRGLKPKFDQRQIAVEVQFGTPSPLLHSDRAKFGHLIELLFTDELLHLPQGSRIRVQTQPGPEPESIGSGVILTIEDNGPGLSEEERQLLFDPFFLRSEIPQEHGLNLMTCFFLVHHHGGRIDVKNATPHGTIFSITLPASPSHKHGSDEPHSRRHCGGFPAPAFGPLRVRRHSRNPPCRLG